MATSVTPTRYNTKGSGPTHKRNRLLLILQQLKNDRSQYEGDWQDLDAYIKRRLRMEPSEQRRRKKQPKVLDVTAKLALRTLASGMHSGLTSPARQWFRLTVPDQDLAQQQEVKVWLHDTAEKIQIAFARSNWYASLPTVYSDEAQFGTAAMMMEEDDETTIRTTTFAPGSYWLGVDSKGRVRTFAREFQMSVWQLVDEFGLENCSKQVQDQYERGEMLIMHDVVHIITPNWEYDPELLRSRDKRYYSCYFEKSGGASNSNTIQPDLGDYKDVGNTRQGFLRESGYDEFPVFGVSWERDELDAYGGDCPGLVALPDVKQLQTGERKTLQMLEKMVSPPMRAPVSLKGQRSSILPSEITYVPDRDPAQYAPAHEIRATIQDAEYKQGQIRGRIERSFFVDLFLMLYSMDDNPNVGKQPISAAEVAERHEEKLLVIGPVLEQNNQGLLSPAINLLFAIMWRRGEITPPPPMMKGTSVRVEFISILHQAQKMVGIGGLERFTQELTALAEIDPSVNDKVNRDRLIEHFADMNGVPPDVMVDDDQVAAVRAERARAAQAQAAAEQAAKLAPAAQKLSQTDPSAGMIPAISEALGGAGGLNA